MTYAFYSTEMLTPEQLTEWHDEVEPVGAAESKTDGRRRAPAGRNVAALMAIAGKMPRK